MCHYINQNSHSCNKINFNLFESTSVLNEIRWSTVLVQWFYSSDNEEYDFLHCVAYSSVDVHKCSREKLVDFYWATWRYNPQNIFFKWAT